MTGVCVLAQGSGAGIGSAVGWILALILVVIVLGLVLMRLRRVFLGPIEDEDGTAMPVAELRRLRDSGELSEEEFRRAIEVMAERAKAASGSGAGRDASGGSGSA